MPGEDIYSWSVTAANNGNADSAINWQEGQTGAAVNNSSRSELAAHAKNRTLLNGSIVTTGTINAQAFLSGNTYTTVTTTMIVRLKFGSGLTNTGSTTLSMDGIGDVLVKTANGDDLLGGEFVGNGYVDLLYDGTNWLFLYGREFMFDRITNGGGIIIGMQKFTTAGTFSYTPTNGMECCIIECGGGGGGTPYTLDGNYGGGGGGSGGYSRALKTAAQVGAAQAVTVGAAGVGGVAGAFNGTGGGSTSVGTLCTAAGGSGGTAGGFGVGGPGGVVGVGDFATVGNAGHAAIGTTAGNYSEIINAQGGASVFGGVAAVSGGFGSAVTGQSAQGYGSGGNGGVCSSTGVPAAGGNGSAGCVIITEFAGKGAPGRDGATGPIGPAGPSGPGTGDVLRIGTPTVGQTAVWVDASHIQGVTPTFPTTQVFTSGSGTYTRPANCQRIEVRMVGGGGGGNGSGQGSGGLGGAGGNTTFGSLI